VWALPRGSLGSARCARAVLRAAGPRRAAGFVLRGWLHAAAAHGGSALRAVGVLRVTEAAARGGLALGVGSGCGLWTALGVGSGRGLRTALGVGCGQRWAWALGADCGQRWVWAVDGVGLAATLFWRWEAGGGQFQEDLGLLAASGVGAGAHALNDQVAEALGVGGEGLGEAFEGCW
jgi:hypothetical protein